MKAKIREILIVLADECHNAEYIHEGSDAISLATKQILALKMKLPKKAKCLCSKDNLWKCECGASQRNSCIEETERMNK